VPLGGSDVIFVSGLVLPLLSLPSGARVSWSGTFETNTPGVCLSWKWGGGGVPRLDAVGADPYAIDYNAARIRPTHSAACSISNGDHAGTPQNPLVRGNVTGGARAAAVRTSRAPGAAQGRPVLNVRPRVPAGSPRRRTATIGGSSELDPATDGGEAVALQLLPAIPNSFTERTTVDFVVGNSGRRVTIAIFDAAGWLVRSMVDDALSAGHYRATWDGRSQDDRQVAGGIYFLRAKVGGENISASPRILYLK
jgi:hypothetical protein